MEIERKCVSVEEAGKMLGLSRPLAYRAVNKGEIPALRIGRRIVVPIVALEKLLNNAGAAAQ